MANYDIRFVLRHAQDYIRQSGWTYTTIFTQNDKATIAATFDPRCSIISCAGKLVKDLKILLAYPPFDVLYTIRPNGSLLINIDKRSTPSKSPPPACPGDPRQNKFTLPIYNPTRRKNNGPDAYQSRNRTSHEPT